MLILFTFVIFSNFDVLCSLEPGSSSITMYHNYQFMGSINGSIRSDGDYVFVSLFSTTRNWGELKVHFTKYFKDCFTTTPEEGYETYDLVEYTSNFDLESTNNFLCFQLSSNPSSENVTAILNIQNIEEFDPFWVIGGEYRFIGWCWHESICGLTPWMYYVQFSLTFILGFALSIFLCCFVSLPKIRPLESRCPQICLPCFFDLCERLKYCFGGFELISFKDLAIYVTFVKVFAGLASYENEGNLWLVWGLVCCLIVLVYLKSANDIFLHTFRDDLYLWNGFSIDLEKRPRVRILCHDHFIIRSSYFQTTMILGLIVIFLLLFCDTYIVMAYTFYGTRDQFPYNNEFYFYQFNQLLDVIIMILAFLLYGWHKNKSRIAKIFFSKFHLLLIEKEEKQQQQEENNNNNIRIDDNGNTLLQRTKSFFLKKNEHLELNPADPKNYNVVKKWSNDQWDEWLVHFDGDPEIVADAYCMLSYPITYLMRIGRSDLRSSKRKMKKKKKKRSGDLVRLDSKFHILKIQKRLEKKRKKMVLLIKKKKDENILKRSKDFIHVEGAKFIETDSNDEDSEEEEDSHDSSLEKEEEQEEEVVVEEEVDDDEKESDKDKEE